MHLPEEASRGKCEEQVILGLPPSQVDSKGQLCSCQTAIFPQILASSSIRITGPPKKDLEHLEDLQSGIPNCQLSNTFRTALKRHLWYLSEKMIGLSSSANLIRVKKVAVMANHKESQRKGLKRLNGRSFSPQTPLPDFMTKDQEQLWPYSPEWLNGVGVLHHQATFFYSFATGDWVKVWESVAALCCKQHSAARCNTYFLSQTSQNSLVRSLTTAALHSKVLREH